MFRNCPWPVDHISLSCPVIYFWITILIRYTCSYMAICRANTLHVHMTYKASGFSLQLQTVLNIAHCPSGIWSNSSQMTLKAC
jgi:hypothetical protein